MRYVPRTTHRLVAKAESKPLVTIADFMTQTDYFHERLGRIRHDSSLHKIVRYIGSCDWQTSCFIIALGFQREYRLAVLRCNQRRVLDKSYLTDRSSIYDRLQAFRDDDIKKHLERGKNILRRCTDEDSERIERKRENYVMVSARYLSIC